VRRPFRSGEPGASNEDSPLVSTSRESWLLSGPVLEWFCVTFFSRFGAGGGLHNEIIPLTRTRYKIHKGRDA
jgi:hypothetical protein